MTTRIYLVESANQPPALVEASSASQAIKKVVEHLYKARIPTTKEVVELLAVKQADLPKAST